MRLLVVGRLNGQIAAAVKMAMQTGAKVAHVETCAAATHALRSGQGADLLMVDYDLDIAGLIAANESERIRVPVVACGMSPDPRRAADAIRAGAKEFIPLPPDAELIAAVLAAVATDDRPLLAADPAMQAVLKLADQVAGSEASLLITGESGVGKEVMARYVHQKSRRADRPFISVNCAAIPENLLESELFGHEKGAFTGASQRSEGRFEQAAGGTLFLDEIGDMPLEAQTRLLRVLQDGTYTTVGGRQPLEADARIVAATHRDLRQMVRQGLFREDLFYRLNVVPIRLPALRERAEDIPELTRHFLKLCQAQGLPPKHLTQEAVERLKAFRWPGNVRELENLVRRLSALYSQESIGLDVIEQELAEAPAQSSAPPAAESLTASIERHLRGYFEAHGDGLPAAGLYDRVLRELERPLLEITLSATRGNQLKAARVLGLNRNTLRKKIKDLDISILKPIK